MIVESNDTKNKKDLVVATTKKRNTKRKKRIVASLKDYCGRVDNIFSIGIRMTKNERFVV